MNVETFSPAQTTIGKSSRSRCSTKQAFLKIAQKLTDITVLKSSFNKNKAYNSTDSSTSAFLWISQNFWKRRLFLCGLYLKKIFFFWKFISRQLLVLKTQKCSLYCFFYICNTFISNARLKLAKGQGNGKQHS